MMLAFGKNVSDEFARKVIEMSGQLGIDPNWLMACIAFESGETFSASVRNAAGSGAIGLIQFMPQTAAMLGTSTADMAAMTPERQLDFVYAYFKPRSGRFRNIEDVYMWILWPAACGHDNEYVLFDRLDAQHPKRYVQNAGLDYNQDGKITKGEAAGHIRMKYMKGLRPEYVREIEA